jgi:hypothetical protein
MSSIRINVDLDISELLWDLSSRDKKQLLTALQEDLEEEGDLSNSAVEVLFGSGATYLEQELGKALLSLWESRNLLNNSQRERLIAMTKESYLES